MAYWLFKTEPDEFSIQDIAASTHNTVRWDGIRNYQARNYLRDAITLGDAVFIYHSRCKEPAIVGLAEVASAAYPDPAQWCKDSPYYDAKSTEVAPRWYCVDIRYVRTFRKALPLQQIKVEPMLAEMTLIHQGRLSVQPVTETQATVILQLTD